MKKNIAAGIIWTLLAVVFLYPSALSAQMGGRGYYGGRCPMCGGPYGGQGQQLDIPEKLPAPANQEWVERLRQVYALEKLSKIQYEADSAQHNTAMPYHMIIFQEDGHIDLIGRLFSAYGISSDVTVPDVKKTSDIKDAYQLGYKLETELMPMYEWLVRNAEDKDSAEVLDFILLQTRMHAAMFSHALSMGWMGPGMGPGRGIR